jgi:predicted NBD/HSP70 family sugar kinase
MMWRPAAEPTATGETLTLVQAAILRLLLDNGPLTRPEIAEQSELSSPTVLHNVADLEVAGLADRIESRQGARGRAAQVYRFGRRSGWVLGIDYGTSHVEFVAIDLTGGVLATHRVALEGGERRPPEPDDALRAELARFRASSSRKFGALRRVGLAVPTIVPPTHRYYRAGGSGADVPDAVGDARGTGPSFDLTTLVDALALPRDVEVTVENNINCSAVAEARRPERRGGDLLYLHLGMGGVGIGVVSDGRLLRGTTGSAGEMRWFPFPFAPDVTAPTFTLEEYFGARGFLGRARAAYAAVGASAPPTVADLFARADDGDALALDVLDTYAANVALALVAFISVIDPATGVLGGGLGNNALLLERAEAHLARLGRPLPLSGDLGETSSAQGAAFLALDLVRRTLGVSDSP